MLAFALWTFGALFATVYTVIWAAPAKVDEWLTSIWDDRRNPLRTELEDAKRRRKMVKNIQGESAQNERQRLDDRIKELRNHPKFLKEQEGERLIATMKPELDSGDTLAAYHLREYERIAHEVTQELTA